MSETFVLGVDRQPFKCERGIVGWSIDSDAIRNITQGKHIVLGYVQETIESPTTIFAGLERTNFKSSICYSALPLGWHDTGFVIVVFATYDQELNEFVVFDFGQRQEDRIIPGRPVNWELDFGEPVYHANS